MNFDESEIGQCVAEQLAHSGLHAVYRLIGHRAKVKDAVVQSRVKVHLGQLLKTAQEFNQDYICINNNNNKIITSQ